jgi:pyruvate/2-oxoglutarate dehydrogenase complex dihydrolipoamide dehydrogenase (E3) component
MVGCETAEFLAAKGKKITIVEILDTLATKVELPIRRLLLERLAEKKVALLTGVRSEEITDKGLVIRDREGRKKTIAADTIVVSAGSKPNNGLIKALKGKAPEIYLAGDCLEPRSLLEAVADGSRIAHAL